MGSCGGIHHVATCLTCQKGAGAMHFIVRQDRINDPRQTNLNRAELGKNGVRKGRRESGERAVQWSGVEASSVWGRWRSVCYKWWSALTFSRDLSLAPHATAKDLKCNLCYAPRLPFDSSLSVCISFCLNVGGPRTIRAWEKRDWPRARREGTKTCCIIFYSKIA